MSLTLYLIRHGTSFHNTHSLIGGCKLIYNLKEQGKQEAALLGKSLSDQNISFDEIYSSPVFRAKQTAQIACSHIINSTTIIYDERLSDIDTGEWKGKKRKKIYTKEQIQQIYNNYWEFTFPKGNSRKIVSEHVIYWINECLEKHQTETKTIAIFTHHMPILCCLCSLLNLDPREVRQWKFSHASATIINFDGTNWKLIEQNKKFFIL